MAGGEERGIPESTNEEQKELPYDKSELSKYSSVNDFILEANELLYSQNDVNG